MADMSGHSKWATIHRQKEVKDAKRGAIFTKLAAAVTVAVRQGGGVTDPTENFRLRLAVEKARQFNMPKENIARAIEKGAGGGAGEVLVEAVYEGFLPGGAVVMVESLTDNKLRTAQSVREVLEKNGGSMAGSGAVGYLFKPLGELRVRDAGLGDEDELKMIDLGADEIVRGEGEWLVYCDKDRTFVLKESLGKGGFDIVEAGLVMKPVSVVEIAQEEMRLRAVKILEMLEDLDDVQKVWTNL